LLFRITNAKQLEHEQLKDFITDLLITGALIGVALVAVWGKLTKLIDWGHQP
jgi:hypothetical protein